jgi:hypothetical protein
MNEPMGDDGTHKLQWANQKDTLEHTNRNEGTKGRRQRTQTAVSETKGDVRTYNPQWTNQRETLAHTNCCERPYVRRYYTQIAVSEQWEPMI